MAIKGLKEYLEEVEKAKLDIDDYTLKVKKLLILKIHANLADINPVDTGTSKISWMISEDSPSSEKPPTAQYGEPEAPDTSNVKPYSKSYLTNNQDYIVALNEGSSDQADAGWVESSVALAEAELEDWVERNK
jgi:hypothetical protein